MRILEAWEVCYTVMDNLHSVLVPSDEKDNLRKAMDTVNYSFHLYEQIVVFEDGNVARDMPVTGVGIDNNGLITGNTSVYHDHDAVVISYDKDKDCWFEVT